MTDLLELVTGYRAIAVDGTATTLAGVVAVSPQVLHIDLDAPLSVLPSVLASPAFGVVPEAAATGGPLADVPVGSGPFRVLEKRDDRLSLVSLGGAGAGTSKRVDFVLFPDRSSSYDAFVAGRVDWTEVPDDRAAEAATHGRVQDRPYVAELFYAFNFRSPKFADRRFREAIVRSVDRDAIVGGVYGGRVRANEGLIVEGFPGHQDDPCGGRCTHDPERAKALLAEIMAAGGVVPEVQIDFDDNPTQTRVAEAIRDDLAGVGITASLRPKPLAEYQQFAVSGEQELFRLGWVAPYASADGILAPLFLTGFPNNLIGFSSATVDEELRAARAESDPARRVEHWQAAERAVLAELPVIPIAQFALHSVSAPRVRGLTVTATGTFDARRVSLAKG